jgi:hypothetical protein
VARLLACAALPAAILAGCGGDDDGGSEVDVGPAAAVPADAPIYVDATVKPTGSAESGAKQALGKVLDTDDPGGKIESLLDEEGRKQTPRERFTYAADVEPWLGEKTAFFATSFAGEGTGAAVVETTNPEQALAFARKSESGATQTSDQGGTTIYTNPADGDSFARAGDFLVFGDTEAVKAAVVAESGSSLGDDGDFKNAIGELPGERLGTLYTVPRNLLDAIGPDEIDQSSRALFEQSAGEALDQPVSGALTASADSFDLEFIGGDTATDTPESTLVGEVPAQSWVAIGAADLGEIVKRSLERSKDQIPNYEEALRQIEQTTGASLDQLTGALGDAALYVEGFTESTLTGALVVEATDPELIGRLLGQVQSLLQLGSSGVKPLRLSGGGTGFQINDPSAPAPIEIALQGGRLVVGYGAGSAERTLTPADTLAQKALFSSAEGRVSDLGTDFFLDFPTVFKLAESMGAKSDPDYVEAKPYLRALSFLISGSGSTGEETEVKAVLGLK